MVTIVTSIYLLLYLTFSTTVSPNRFYNIVVISSTTITAITIKSQEHQHLILSPLPSCCMVP